MRGGAKDWVGRREEEATAAARMDDWSLIAIGIGLPWRLGVEGGWGWNVSCQTYRRENLTFKNEIV